MDSPDRSLKWFGNKILIFLLFNFLVFTVFYWVVVLPFTRQEQIKSWIAEAGVYDNVAEAVIELSKQGEQSFDEGDVEEVRAALETEQIPYDQLLAAVQKAYPAESLQTKAETVIDGIYNWLQGETPSPEFSVSLIDGRDVLAAEITTILVNRVNALPPCTTQAEILAQRALDPLEATCLPPGLDVQGQVDAYVDEFKNSEFFTKGFTSESLDLDQNEIATAPKGYANVQNGRIWLPILTILLAAGIIFTARTKLKGVRSLGLTVMTAGIVLLIGFMIMSASSNAIIEAANNQTQPQGEAMFDKVLAPLIRDVSVDLVGSGYAWSITLVVLGLAAWFIARYFMKKNETPSPGSKPKTPVDTPKPTKQNTKQLGT